MSHNATVVPVALGDRSYPIVISTHLLENDIRHDWLADKIQGDAVCIVTNETIAPLYLDALKRHLTAYQVHEIILPDGEAFKNLDTLNRIIDGLLEKGLNRRVCLIALGGGVIGDMTGFAAATYQRGVDFIQVPTTLLSQVDSSVGGKTGVNHPRGKNMIGAFKQPRSVLIDTASLSTLPDREFAAGMAEVIKYGLIWDADFFEWLESHATLLQQRDASALVAVIARSCEIKAKVVAADETEQGIRAILNLGHTFGHAIEAHMGYGQWLHGEAVAVGMLMAVRMSAGLDGTDVYDRLSRLLSAFDLPLLPPAGMTKANFLTYMAVDKKNITQHIRLVLLTSLGDAEVTSDYSAERLSQVFDFYNA